MLRPLLGLLLIFCVAGKGNAQRNRVFTSFESQINQSSFVGAGTIVSQGDVATMEISEVIKGPVTKTILLTTYDHAGMTISDAGHVKVLVFIRGPLEPREPNRKWHLMFLNPAIAFDLPDSETYVTMEMKKLKTETEVLRTARDYAKRFSAFDPEFSWRYIPKSLGQVTHTSGELYVPVNSRLEQVATRMIQNPKSFLPHADQFPSLTQAEYQELAIHDEGQVRFLGVSALANFKSDRNLKILRGCLTDTHIEPYWEEKFNVYWIRKKAYDTLVHWGVHLQPPVLYAPKN